MRLSTHAQRLERWLGVEQTEAISRMMRGFYGPPIAVANVPGTVFVGNDGDFRGPIRGGYYASAVDYSIAQMRSKMRRVARRQMSTANAGFSSLSDLISEATVGAKQQLIPFSKTGTAGAAGLPISLWNVGSWPVAGGVGGTSGTGAECTRSTTGATKQDNAAGGDQLHLISLCAGSSIAGVLMLYDRLWHMTYDHAASTSTAIDSNNRPQRYQTSGLAPGNFIGGEVTTQLVAQSHTVTITYVDDAGNTAEAAAAYTQAATTAVNKFWSSSAAPTWFIPLNSGDRGARYLTNIAQSTTASVTGVQNFWVGHPLAFVPIAIDGMFSMLDNINSAFNLVRIYDDACLAWVDMFKTTTTLSQWDGLMCLVSG